MPIAAESAPAPPRTILYTGKGGVGETSVAAATARRCAADGLRTNVLHLPVVGSGDGGAYSTVTDVHAFWGALFAGRIVQLERVAEMVRPRSAVPEERRRCGLGLYLEEAGDGVVLEGHDAGVSFLSVHRPSTSTTWTVVSNWTDGAWPVATLLQELVTG